MSAIFFDVDYHPWETKFRDQRSKQLVFIIPCLSPMTLLAQRKKRWMISNLGLGLPRSLWFHEPKAVQSFPRLVDPTVSRGSPTPKAQV